MLPPIEYPDYLRVQPLIITKETRSIDGKVITGFFCEECGSLQDSPKSLANHWVRQHRRQYYEVSTALVRWLGYPIPPQKLDALSRARGSTWELTEWYVRTLRETLGLELKVEAGDPEGESSDPCPEQCNKSRPYIIGGPHPVWVCADCWAAEACNGNGLTDWR